LTSNVNTHPPRSAITAPVFSVFCILSLTRENTKSWSPTILTGCHSWNTASATATQPPTTCDSITEAFGTDSGWLVHVFWFLNSHNVMLRDILISPITGKMEESDPPPPTK
jgi:hypothetical protein